MSIFQLLFYIACCTLIILLNLIISLLLLRIIIFIVTVCFLYKKKKKSNLAVSKILPVNIFYIYYIIADNGTPHLDASLERFRKQHFVRNEIFRNTFLIIVVIKIMK